MEQVIDGILGLRGAVVYVVVGLLAFAEAAAFVGLFVPGEIAVLVGGVLAAQGRVSLPALIAVVAVGAIAGDAAGYEIGRRWGVRLLDLPVMRRHGKAVALAHDGMRRYGGFVVFVGRWTSVLRAVVPFVAGSSRMPYRRFFVYNVMGGAAWAGAFATLGFVAGASFRRVEAWVGHGSWVLALVVVAGIGVRWAIARRRARAGRGRERMRS